MIIYKNDSYFLNKKIIGIYDIAIYGYSACVFSIKITCGQYTITELEKDRSVYDKIEKKGYIYYSYKITSLIDIIINFNNIQGKGVIFASIIDSTENSAFDNLPNEQQFL